MKTYEFDGEKYKTASSHQKEWGQSLISQLSLQGNEQILDLGCGDGILTGRLAALVPDGKVLGIDSSIGMIKTAQKITMDNLEFIRMDISDLDFVNTFDVIFSNAALHWVKDHRRLLRNSYTALKEGGIILWDFGGSGNCSSFFEVIRKKIADEKYCSFFKNFEWPWFMPSKDQYEKFIFEIGYSDFLITEVNRDRYFPSSEEMIKWIDQPSIVPFLDCIPDMRKSAFRKEVIDEMIEKTKQPDGTCFETFRRLRIYAEK